MRRKGSERESQPSLAGERFAEVTTINNSNHDQDVTHPSAKPSPIITSNSRPIPATIRQQQADVRLPSPH
jgi:hypothetical protein